MRIASCYAFCPENGRDWGAKPIYHQGPLCADKWCEVGQFGMEDLGEVWFVRSAIGQLHPQSYIPERVFAEVTEQTLEWCHSLTHMTTVESLYQTLAQGIIPMGRPIFLSPFNVTHPHHAPS